MILLMHVLVAPGDGAVEVQMGRFWCLSALEHSHL